MKHLGDISRINGAGIEPADCITFGSPCQDLSVAGKRAGLAGERSGLFMEAVKIIREMRESTNGKYPAFAVWENVPGAFSSNKGEDFRTVLEELAKVKEPGAAVPGPPKGKWRNAGAVMGDGWSIAWRVMDAQYWGVPQRRRRIALVMDFRGQRAGEILFERKSVQGNPSTGGETQKTPAGNFGTGIERDDSVVGDAGYCAGFNGHKSITGSIQYAENISPTLDTSKAPQVICAGFSGGQGSKAGGVGYQLECSPALKSSDSGSNRTPCVIYDARGNGGGDICPTLTGDHQSRVTDYTAICIAGNCIDRADTVGCNGKGWKEDVSFTLNTIDRPAIMCMASTQKNGGILKEKAPTLTCRHDQPIINTGYIVRRLTPLECERLQGYPDGWTDIGAWTDTKGKQHKTCSDTARYKALGNSIALPQWMWLMSKMAEYLPAGAKLGSLFDGIGGFPLCWECIHGQGTARWASEIDEFPIAVTKHHFGEE